MDQIHQRKSKSGYEFPVAALDPEEVMQKWQARAFRLMHAQERIAQGMAAAARAQLRYGQEFMVSRTGLLHWDTTEPGHMAEQAQRDFEQLVSVVREVSAEIRSGFSEAAKMLAEEAPEELREGVHAAADTANRMVVKTEEAEEAMAKAATETVAEPAAAVEKTRGAAQKAGKEMAETVRRPVRRTRTARK